MPASLDLDDGECALVRLDPYKSPPRRSAGYNVSCGQTVNTSLIIRDAELTSSTYTRYSFRSGSRVGGLMCSQFAEPRVYSTADIWDWCQLNRHLDYSCHPADSNGAPVQIAARHLCSPPLPPAARPRLSFQIELSCAFVHDVIQRPPTKSLYFLVCAPFFVMLQMLFRLMVTHSIVVRLRRGPVAGQPKLKPYPLIAHSCCSLSTDRRLGCSTHPHGCFPPRLFPVVCRLYAAHISRPREDIRTLQSHKLFFFFDGPLSHGPTTIAETLTV